MVLAIQLPDDLAQHANFAREAMESLAIECYRTQALSPRQCREMLDLSRIEFEGFLKRYDVEEGAYDIADLERDLQWTQSFTARVQPRA